MLVAYLLRMPTTISLLLYLILCLRGGQTDLVAAHSPSLVCLQLGVGLLDQEAGLIELQVTH